MSDTLEKRMRRLMLRKAKGGFIEPGQEETKTPSRDYVEAAREVQEWIRANHPEQQRSLI